MNFLQQLKQKAKHLKTEAQVLMIAYKDSRTPLSAKILIGITVGYLLSPIDLIPDFIPVLGWLDDLLIVPLLISASIKLIPAIVLSNARETALHSSHIFKKDNWVVASIIIIVWITVVFFLGRFLNYKLRERGWFRN